AGLLFAAGPWTRATAAQRAAINAPLASREDRSLSPFTGYTRRHWLEIAERLLAGSLPHLDPESGMPRLEGVPGDRGHAALFPLNATMACWQAMERIMM